MAKTTNQKNFLKTPSFQQTLDVSEWGDKIILYKYTTDFGSGFNDRVFDAKYQSDGKLITGGDFTIFQENNSSKIVRINSDGSYDPTFNIGTGFNDLVRVIAIQLDGKIIVGGVFTSYNGTTANRIIRLNTDGSIDGAFVTGTGFGNRVFGITIQPDGKILVLGEFTIYNGTAINRVVRLNTNGSIDGTFVVGTGFNNIPRKASIQADGKFIICGEFTNYNGTTVNRIARLNTDGSIDGTFATGTGFNDFTENTHILPDGKIYVFGGFTSYNGTTANRIIRLNTNGSIDGAFVTGTGFNDRVRTIGVQTDGQLLVSGEFTLYNGISAAKAIRLNSDGTVNNAFIQGTGFNDVIWHVIVIESNNKMLFFGEFTSYNNYSFFNIVELNEFGDFREKVFTFNQNNNGIAEYKTDKTFNELEDHEILNKKIIFDYLESISSKFIFLSTDQTTDSTTSVNITEFNYNLEANSIYTLRGKLRVGCNNTGGVKVSASTPLSDEGLGTVFGRRNTDLAMTIASPDSVTGVLPTTSLNNVASSFGQAFFDFMVFTGDDPDVFNLVFASATAGQISTIYRLGSYLEIIKLN